MDEFRDRIVNGKSPDEKFEAIVDILADISQDLKEMKSDMKDMKEDLGSWTEVRDGVLFGKKLLTGTAAVIVAIASIGGGILYLINHAIKHAS